MPKDGASESRRLRVEMQSCKGEAAALHIERVHTRIDMQVVLHAQQGLSIKARHAWGTVERN